MKRQHYSNRSSGFTVIEAMVALIVISIGLLGVAKMQALTISSTSTSRLRSLAAIEGASLAASMYANRAFWGTIPATLTVTVEGTTATTGDAGLKAALATVSGSSNKSSYCQVGTGAPCSPVLMAATDLQQWADDVSLRLPGSISTVDCPTISLPRTCIIRISWTEHAVAMTKQQAKIEDDRDPDADPYAMINPDFQLFVEP